MSPIVLGAIAALAWGTHDFGARFAGLRIGVLTTLLCVTIAGFAGMTALLLFTGSDFPELKLEGVWLLVLMGGGYALATLWIYEALTRGPFALVSPIVGAYPVSAMLIFVALGERPPLLQWLAIGVVVIGVAIVAGTAQPHAEDTIETDRREPASAQHGTNLTITQFRTVLIFAALSHLAFAVSMTSGQFAAPIYGTLQATWLSRIAGLAVVLLVVARQRTLQPVPLIWIPIVIGMGLCDVFALALTSEAGHLPNAGLATVTSSTFGIFTILLARVFLAEKIRPVQWFGIALVFSGSAYLAA